jgi:nucleoside-diphosphate-sugar epimerase
MIARSRVLVLGASGFIGRRVVALLAASDWALAVAARHRSSARTPPGVEETRLDATDPSALARVLRDVVGVVNCVTGPAETIVAGARALFESAAASGLPSRIVHLSTMSVYGSARGEVSEQAPLRGDLDAYSAAKVRAEALAQVCETVVHLRPGIVYGPESLNWSDRIGRWLVERRLGDLGDAGSGICNLVHVDDVAAAAVRALRTPGIDGQAFNLGLPEALTWNEYFAQYAAALGVAPLRTISPLRWQLELKLLGPPLKAVEIAAGAARLGWRPPLPIRPWLATVCRHDIRLNVNQAEDVLGMQWTPLASGLRETAAWFHGERGRPR